MPTGPTFPPQFFNRGAPLTSTLEMAGAYTIINTAKTLTITGSDDLAFGIIAGDTNAVVTLEYVSTQMEEFLLAVGVRYAGDAGAFQITAGDGTGAFATPIDLVDGETYWMVIPPDTANAAPMSFTVTAINADSGVEKTGTLSIYDRFDFTESGAGEPTRTLDTLSLSKTGS